MIETSAREQQRVEHLVLGRPRPKVKKLGKRIRRRDAPAIELAPDVDQALALREAWSHKAGTPETHERAFEQLGRCGALARLHIAETIDQHQLAAGVEIAQAHAAVTADVSVRIARWGQRGSVSPDGATAERVGAIVLDMAYTRWRTAVGPNAAMLLAIIVDDVALTIAAKRWRRSNRTARRILTEALDLWRRT